MANPSVTRKFADSDLTWRKSTLSGDQAGNCLYVASDATGNVLVRNSTDGDHGPVLKLTPGEWTAFRDGLKAGEFDQL